MSKNLNFDLKAVAPLFKKYWAKVSKHMTFIIIICVLFVFLFVVWHINSLATAEPSDEAEQAALTSAKIHKIDQKAIDQIQSLENNSPAVHSLFDRARNNPFKE